MNSQNTAASTRPAKTDDLDKALEGTFPASDPVSVGSARKEREHRIEREEAEEAEEAGKTEVPKIEIDDEAMPAEKPM